MRLDVEHLTKDVKRMDPYLTKEQLTKIAQFKRWEIIETLAERRAANNMQPPAAIPLNEKGERKR